MVDMNHDGRVRYMCFSIVSHEAQQIRSHYNDQVHLHYPHLFESICTPGTWTQDPHVMHVEAMFKVDDFVNELCKRWNFDAKGEIDCEEYMRACLAHEVRTHAHTVHIHA